VRIAGVAIALALVCSTASAADIVGQIADANGAPVIGTQVMVQDLDGKSFASATTNPAGHYEIHGLEPGAYNLIVRGQSAVAYVGKDGLSVNWGVAKDVPPVAIARKGIGGATASADHKRPVSPVTVEGK
jgi:Carboxypeptidase regulatory-like domain